MNPRSLGRPLALMEQWLVRWHGHCKSTKHTNCILFQPSRDPTKPMLTGLSNGQSINKLQSKRNNSRNPSFPSRERDCDEPLPPLKSTCHCLCQPSEFASLSSARFQVLFHSPFGVLFIFRSHYLFAIGLLPIFSLARDLPRTLRCTPKQRDSPIAQFNSACIPSHTGLSPSLAVLSRHT